MNHIFPAGKYWIGDPCYAIKNENWSKMIDETGCFGLELEIPVKNWDNGFYEYNGEICFTDGTRYGDGCYSDNFGNGYGVDAGMIGILPIGACDGGSMDGGNIIQFDHPFIPRAKDGVFKFGHIEIDTSDDSDDWEKD